MIKHVVLLKKNENVTEEQTNRLFAQFRQLSDIPGTEGLDFGENFSKLAQGYDLCLSVNFENKDLLKSYNRHPIHLEVVKTLQELELELAVIDYEIKD